MGAIFHNGKIYSGGGLLNLVTKSWSDYSALSLEERNDSTKWYFVPDAPASGVPNIVKSVRDNITDVYVPESTYDKDDWCIHDNKLYICTTNNTTGEWDSTKWTRKNLEEIISSLNSAITHIEDIVETYTFPKNQSEVSGGNNSYTVQHNGTAIITYKFASQAYSQFGLSVNGKSITPGNISSGSVTLGGLTGVITLPVFKDDVISVSFYQTYGMDLISLRLGAKV